MTREEPDKAEIAGLRALIAGFVEERLQLKLDKLKDGEAEKRLELQATHRPEAWIADAARRVAQIQLVTHALKYTHPEARGSNLHSTGNPQAGDALVGSHTLGEDLPEDVVGNAAALDVYKFLRLEYANKSLLRRAIGGDPALRAAFGDSHEEAEDWMQAFAGITRDKGAAASHPLAKQLYWPLPEGGYHLLAPLYPTSLVQAMHRIIREDRFSEAGKAARAARQEGRPHSEGYREYPGLAIQKFGGTKPQNVSQLNSERHGEGYLLPSCPPNWRSQGARPPLAVPTVLSVWLQRRPALRELTRSLREFLRSTGDYTNRRIRDTRAELVARICDEVLQFAAEIQELPADWSADPNCRLNADEQFWLDPYRAETDPDFAQRRQHSDWVETVCQRFGNWLNARLGDKQNPMGDAENHEWSRVLDREMHFLRLELENHD
ncbi:type I-F CRISPR-associated protein Csy1 [Azotobacter armeniacus]